MQSHVSDPHYHISDCFMRFYTLLTGSLGDRFVIKHGGVISKPLYIKLLPIKLTNQLTTLTNQQTNSTQHTHSHSQNSPSFTVTKGLSLGHNSPSLIPIMSQKNPVCIFPLYFFNSHSDIILPFTPGSSKKPLLNIFSN